MKRSRSNSADVIRQPSALSTTRTAAAATARPSVAGMALSAISDSPTLFATDRTDRVTYIAQGWKVTDPQLLTDVGPLPDHETLIEIPEEVLKFYARRYQEEERN